MTLAVAEVLSPNKPNQSYLAPAVLYQLSPQLGEDPPPPVEDPAICDPPGKPGWLVGSAFDCEPMCCRFESSRGCTFRFPPVLRDWVLKGLGM